MNINVIQKFKSRRLSSWRFNFTAARSPIRSAGLRPGGLSRVGWFVPGQRPALRSFSLIELLVYIALFAVVTGFGFAAFFQCRATANSLRRTSDDIVLALQAGERWREDVRSAVAPLQFVDGDDAQQVIVPLKTNQVAYRFSKQAVWRRGDANAAWVPLLPSVKHSRMERDARQQVTAWRWEVELKTKQPEARLRPLFTFEAVSLGGTKP